MIIIEHKQRRLTNVTEVAPSSAGVVLNETLNVLQLPSSSYRTRFLPIHGFRISLLLFAGPSKSPQSLRQDWMREMIAGIHPVCVHGTQILYLKFDQRLRQLSGVAELDCEFV